MSDSLVILGRQPALGMAELESLYGGKNVRPVGAEAALLAGRDPCGVAFVRLGGAVKLCNVLTTLDTVKWPDIQRFLETAAPQHIVRMPAGKMQLGLSAYGLKVTAGQMTATGLSVKKAIRATGRSVRLVPNDEPALNSAQVLHNHLTGPTGWELVFIRDGQRTICAQTVCVQDITAYAARDQGRPRRDPLVGMLPPKLAQIIINLAAGHLPDSAYAATCTPETTTPPQAVETPSSRPRPQTILDPFCGTGVVLQEALLMGYDAYGTDLEPRMIEYSQQNLGWLQRGYPRTARMALTLEPGDATNHRWQRPFDAVASETYLGQPITVWPEPAKLETIMATCNTITEKFLRNIGGQIPAGTRLCLAVPAWHNPAGAFHHLSLLDQLNQIGYNRVRFEHVGDAELLYFRPGQLVARELLVITRK